MIENGLAISFLQGHGFTNSANWGINKYGFVIHNGGDVHGPVTKAVQIFKSGEIWAINANFIRREEKAIIPPFEEMFEKALQNYKDFLSTQLSILGPYKFIAGMTGVEHCSLYIPNPPSGYWVTGNSQGLCVDEEIVYEGIIGNNSSVNEVLLPFFENVYETCGLERSNWTKEASS